MKKIVISIMAFILMSLTLMAENNNNQEEINNTTYEFVYSKNPSDSYVIINDSLFTFNEGEIKYKAVSDDKKWISTTYQYGNSLTVTVICRGSGTGCEAEKEKAWTYALTH